MNAKRYIISFLIVFIVIAIFGLFDFLAHQIDEEYAVPGYYYKNKMIYGTLWGLIAYLFLRKKKLWTKSIVFSAIVSILLQIRYYLEGYPKEFVFLFLAIHFIILFPVSYLIFKFTDKLVNR